MPANIRASLKPYWLKARGKWYPRGTYPIRDEAGRIARRSGFLGTGRDTRSACQEECDRLNAQLEHDATAGPRAPSFAEAALVYLKLGGDGRFLTDKLMIELGPLYCDQITDAVMVRTIGRIYPKAAPATLNRQLYTPVIAALKQAAKGQEWRPHDLTRPKGYSVLKPARSPDDAWFAKVLPAATPEMRALLMVSTLHGFRVGELVRLEPRHFDPHRRTIIVETKNGTTVVEELAGAAYEAIAAYNWRNGPGLFGTLTQKNRRGVFRMLERLCSTLGVEYFPPHKVGRHAFAKRLLLEGKSLAHVKAAGRWKSMKPVAELYGTFAHDEVAKATREAGDQWARKLERPEEAVVVKLPVVRKR